MPSSVIYGMRYEPRGRVLDVVFRGGRGTYRYFGVPVEVWREFVRAPSKGTFLNTTFKEKGYGYERVEGRLAGVAAAAGDEGADGKAVADGAAVAGGAGAGAGRGFRDLPDGTVWGFYE